jgi:hypothetical protein
LVSVLTEKGRIRGYGEGLSPPTLEGQELKSRLWGAGGLQTVPDLRFVESPFLRRRVARGVEEQLALKAPAVEDGKFGGRWWWMALGSRHPDTVLAHRRDADVLDVGLDVRVEVDGALEFVQELAFNDVFVDDAFAGVVRG